MTILDGNLIFQDNASPVRTVAVGAGWVPFHYPDGLSGNTKWLDLLAENDIGRGHPVYAHFIVTEAFDNVVGNFWTPYIVIDSTSVGTTFTTFPELMIARGPELPSSKLTLGAHIVIAIPPINSKALALTTGGGARYLFVGESVLIPTTDWSTGKITCYLSHDAGKTVNKDFPAGF